MTLHQIRIEPASLDVSIVIPVYNEELNVEALAGEISGTMRGAGYTSLHSTGMVRAIPPT